jgi:catechol 2,3-dioxygenase-like lactoylglutathione lyase family enzyme
MSPEAATHNVEQAVPFFRVRSMEASLRFYTEGLGFTMTKSWTPRDKIEWCLLQLGGAAMMLQEYRPGRVPESKLGVGVSICLPCKDAVAIYREVRGRGIPSPRPFVGNGLWVVSVTDPDGYTIEFESPTDVPEETELAEWIP